MIIALLVIASVVSVPIAAIVIVSLASRREDAVWSLGQPPQGMVQAIARRVLDFSTECPALQQPKNCSQVSPALPAPGLLGQQGRSTGADAPRPVAPSKVSIGTAA